VKRVIRAPTVRHGAGIGIELKINSERPNAKPLLQDEQPNRIAWDRLE
jgi:hypothetical protein